MPVKKASSPAPTCGPWPLPTPRGLPLVSHSSPCSSVGTHIPKHSDPCAWENSYPPLASLDQRKITKFFRACIPSKLYVYV